MKFSLALSGSGNLMQRFGEMLKVHYPGITVYDRNVETVWGPSVPIMLSHLEVADIDAIFTRFGPRELITLRCAGRHRLFNCISDPGQVARGELDHLLQKIVQAVGELLNATKAAAEAAIKNASDESSAPEPTPPEGK